MIAATADQRAAGVPRGAARAPRAAAEDLHQRELVAELDARDRHPEPGRQLRLARGVPLVHPRDLADDGDLALRHHHAQGDDLAEDQRALGGHEEAAEAQVLDGQALAVEHAAGVVHRQPVPALHRAARLRGGEGAPPGAATETSNAFTGR